MEKVRIRWYAVPHTRSTIGKIAGSIANLQYNDQRGHGFILDEVRGSRIVGRHIERTERVVVTRGPFGDELRQSIVGYIHTRFRLSAESPGLELIDPPRSPRFILSQLSTLSEFNFTITPILVDPVGWIGGVDSHNRDAMIHKLDCEDIDFRGGIHGSLRLEGASDVCQAAAKILGTRSHLIRRVTAQIREHEDSPWSVVVERDARATIQAEDIDSARSILRSALAQMIA